MKKYKNVTQEVSAILSPIGSYQKLTGVTNYRFHKVLAGGVLSDHDALLRKAIIETAVDAGEIMIKTLKAEKGAIK